MKGGATYNHRLKIDGGSVSWNYLGDIKEGFN
jgi:hypothetical protein